MSQRVIHDWQVGDKITADRLNTVDSRVDADMLLLADGDNYIEKFTAFEDIAEGDLVGLSHYTPPTTGNVMSAVTTAGLGNEAFGGFPAATNCPGNYFEFPNQLPTGEEVIDITSIELKLVGTVANQPTIQVGVTEAIDTNTLVGDVFTSALATQTYPTVGSGITWFAVPTTGLLQQNKKYFVWATKTAGIDFPRIYWGELPNVNHTRFNDNYNLTARWGSGATLTNMSGVWPDATEVFEIQITGVYMNSKNHLQVFKASASAFDTRFSFVGYATADALQGDPASFSTYFKQTRTGLTAGKHYYLSNTAGELSDTPGTIPLYVGTAIDATTLVRLNSMANQSSFVALTAGSITFQQNGLFAQTGGNTTTHYQRIVPNALTYTTNVNFTGVTNCTFPVLAGDKVTFGANCYFYPTVSLRN